MSLISFRGHLPLSTNTEGQARIQLQLQLFTYLFVSIGLIMGVVLSKRYGNHDDWSQED